MKRKAKKLLRLLFLLSILLTIMAAFFVWDASRQLPLAVGDRILLAQGQPGEVATVGISIYNNGRRPIKLERAELSGSGWELSSAQITTGLSYSPKPLEIWAAEHRVSLKPLSGYRLGKQQNATLGVSLKRTNRSTTGGSTLVLTYRLWWFRHQLRIALD